MIRVRTVPSLVGVLVAAILGASAYVGDAVPTDRSPGAGATAGGSLVAGSGGHAGSGAGPAAESGAPRGTGAGPRSVAGSMVPVDPERRAVRTALRGLLRSQVEAIHEHDLARYRATLSSPSSPRGRAELATVRRMWALHVTGMDWSPHSLEPLDGSSSRWLVTVTGSYRVHGVDRGPRRFTRVIEAVSDARGWHVVGRATPSQRRSVTPGPGAVWDLPGAQVVWTRSGPVVGTVPVAALRADGRMLEAATAEVAGVCDAPRPRVVLAVPATVAQLQTLVDGVDVTQVAAVTVGDIADGDVARADRVVVNPLGFADITPAGRQVVLSHELTHVALRGSVVGAPETWLSEGLADTVGYAAAGLTERQVAANLLATVRDGRGPSALPTDTDFAGGSPRIDLSYQAAYVAVRLLRSVDGIAGVCRLYRAEASAGGSAGVRRAGMWSRVLGESRADFTASWLHRLRVLAGS